MTTPKTFGTDQAIERDAETSERLAKLERAHTRPRHRGAALLGVTRRSGARSDPTGLLRMTCLFLIAVLASAAFSAVAGAEKTPNRHALAVKPIQTCSRPSTCATDAAQRAQALATPDRVGHPARLADPNPAREGFDWRDGGVGASAGFGLALLGGACLLAIRRRGRAPAH